jgi:hypothetical protein
VAPWLITTSAWPVVTAHLAGPTARLVVDPVIAGVATIGALAVAGALVLLCERFRHPRPHGRSM